MTTTKRIKSNVEKSYISQMWVQRNRYNESKAEFESIFGSWQDGENMKRAENKMKKLRNELNKERNKRMRIAV